jgi:hypothetical protein
MRFRRLRMVWWLSPCGSAELGLLIGPDVVMQYCFGTSDHHIETPGFDPLFHDTSFGAAKAIATLRHLNWILDIMVALPEFIAAKMGEEVSSTIRLKRVRIIQAWPPDNALTNLFARNV